MVVIEDICALVLLLIIALVVILVLPIVFLLGIVAFFYIIFKDIFQGVLDYFKYYE